MLATAIDALPRGEGWAYEFKWDGVRVLVDVSERGMTVSSRAGNDVSIAYPELGALADAGDVLLDGEIVAFVDGRPSFDALQNRMHVRANAEARRLVERTPVSYMVFDVLRCYGVDLTARPYRERRATLDRWLGERGDLGPITASPSFDDGPAIEATAREHGLEGVVAKKLDSAYRPGVRSRDWGKLRFVRNGDFVVIGWEAPVGDPDRLSSLVLARYVDGVLHFAGKVGSGLTGRSAPALQRRLTARHRCVIAPEPPRSPGRVTRWVDPDTVVEVEFAVWTDEGRLRHPVFRRLRTDKAPEEAIGDG